MSIFHHGHVHDLFTHFIDRLVRAVAWHGISEFESGGKIKELNGGPNMKWFLDLSDQLQSCS